MTRGGTRIPYCLRILAPFLAPLAVLSKEVLLVIFVDRAGMLSGNELFIGGSSTGFQTRYRKLFERAFHHRASGIVLVHNHPSGSARPSRQDLISTRALEALARPMEIKLVDHLIVGATAIFSMRSAGLLG